METEILQNEITGLGDTIEGLCVMLGLDQETKF